MNVSAREDLPNVVVIGGGFCGAAFAIHLLRDHPQLHCRLTVIEPRPRLGAGLAYGTVETAHRINVAAARMALFEDDPTHFHRWLEARDEATSDPASALADGRLYPRRSRFGEYVSDILATLVRDAGPRITFAHIRDRAVDVRPTDSAAAPLEIRLAGGGTLVADQVIIAVSHPPPERPAILAGVPAERVISDPWGADALAAIAPAARVLIVGSGLTGADVVASLAARGHHGPVTALSRHGWWPRPRTHLDVSAYGDFAIDPERTASGLLRRIRVALVATRLAGRPWEDVIDALRRDAPVLWRALSHEARRRVLRHARSMWDVHRFQMAPQIEAALDQLTRAAILRLRAGRVLSAHWAGDFITIDWRPRGAGEIEQLAVDYVITCTGPGHGSVLASNALLAAMAANGLVRADGLGLGLDVTPQDHAVGRDGQSQPRIFVAGPLARSAHGELMGLPQVADQPRRIAARVATVLAQSRTNPAPLPAGSGAGTARRIEDGLAADLR